MTTPPHTQPDASQIAREIRAGLDGVTPGPWKYAYSRERDFTAIFPETARSEFPIAKMPGYIKQRVQDTDGRHLARCSPDRIAALLDAFDAQAREIAELRAHVALLKRRDTEAANYVESVIVMRTHFTGDQPYVGWKGLGLALTEALNERDALRAKENPNG